MKRKNDDMSMKEVENPQLKKSRSSEFLPVHTLVKVWFESGDKSKYYFGTIDSVSKEDHCYS